MTIPTTYEIEYKCGHTGTRDLSDVAAGQRAGKVAWMETTKCFDCFKATGDRKISKERKAEHEKLREDALYDQERSSLPILRGSDKQQLWALDCRFKLIRDAYEDLVQEGDLPDSEFEGQVLVLARRIGVAKWWIDNRETTTDGLLELLADPGITEDEYANENPH